LKEDLIGDIDIGVALAEGLHSTGAFVPGKLLRANHGVLLIDFIDRVPERVLNSVLYPLQGESITIGPLEEMLYLDILVVGTGQSEMLGAISLDMADCFDVIRLDYINNPRFQREIVLENLPKNVCKSDILDKVIDIVNRTRQHEEVLRGVSTRGMINYAAISCSSTRADDETLLKKGALISLPHRLKMPVEADTPEKRTAIVNEIIADEFGKVRKEEEEIVTLSRETLEDLVEELVREDSFRIPLKYGAFDFLLQKVKKLSDTKLSLIYSEMRQKLAELYPERYGGLTLELLEVLEKVRKDDSMSAALRNQLDADALEETIKALVNKGIIEHDETGWGLSQKALTLLLQGLGPKLLVDRYTYGYGKHTAGKQFNVGEGRIVGTRHYHFGDRYRDISLKDTIREAIRNRHRELVREDIKVVTKEICTKMNIILVVDLSGTMRQLQKLWYAKQSAIALSLAASYYGDNIGVVAFSNLAEIVIGLSKNTYKISKKVLDLELHENAFTNIGFSIKKACSLLAHYPKGKARQHIILVSDGDATAPHPSPQKYALSQAAIASRRAITISTVCIAQQSCSPDLMHRIAKIGRGRTYFVGADELPSTILRETFSVHAD
jgi:Mg-chelatase subunit ChlD/MoxR-like ATPase